MVRFADGFVFYTPVRVFYWLPSSGFADRGELERLALLARSKVAAYEDRRAAGR